MTQNGPRSHSTHLNVRSSFGNPATGGVGFVQFGAIVVASLRGLGWNLKIDGYSCTYSTSEKAWVQRLHHVIIVCYSYNRNPNISNIPSTGDPTALGYLWYFLLPVAFFRKISIQRMGPRGTTWYHRSASQSPADLWRYLKCYWCLVTCFGTSTMGLTPRGSRCLDAQIALLHGRISAGLGGFRKDTEETENQTRYIDIQVDICRYCTTNIDIQSYCTTY